jgi:hypothetical protein
MYCFFRSFITIPKCLLLNLFLVRINGSYFHLTPCYITIGCFLPFHTHNHPTPPPPNSIYFPMVLCYCFMFLFISCSLHLFTVFCAIFIGFIHILLCSSPLHFSFYLLFYLPFWIALFPCFLASRDIPQSFYRHKTPPTHTTPICLFPNSLQPFYGKHDVIHLYHYHSFIPPRILYSPFFENKMPFIYTIPALALSAKPCLHLPYFTDNFLPCSLFINPNWTSRFLWNVSAHLPDQ